MIRIESICAVSCVEQVGASCGNGTSLQLVALEGNIERLPVGLTSYQTLLQIPAGNKVILGAGWRVEAAVTLIAAIALGIPGTPGYFTASDTPSLAAGSAVIYQGLHTRYDAAPIPLLLTSLNGAGFGGGSLRFAVQYLALTPPAG
jgi:hypothetical protein